MRAGRERCAALLALALGAAACEEMHPRAGESHGAASPEAVAVQVAEPIVEDADRWTADIETVAVRVRAGEAEREFLVASRAHVAARCTQCHADGEVLEAAGPPARAHWEIARPHGGAEGLSCRSCHLADDPARLVVPGAEPVAIERAHRACATCHFQQVRDWAGGAHGKRLAAWAGPRVVEACTGCHDPHDPGFPVRLPTTFSPPPEE